jgi:hypothetical protein
MNSKNKRIVFAYDPTYISLDEATAFENRGRELGIDFILIRVLDGLGTPIRLWDIEALEVEKR